MKEYIVYSRTPSKANIVSHVYINATSKEEALKLAGEQLPKTKVPFRADEMCEWSVDKT